MDAVLVYDGDCRMCVAAARVVKAFDWRRRVATRPLQDPESGRLLGGMDANHRASSFHIVQDGRAASGGEGVIVLLGLLPLGGGIPKLAARMPLVGRASASAYGILHRVRDGLHCAM